MKSRLVMATLICVCASQSLRAQNQEPTDTTIIQQLLLADPCHPPNISCFRIASGIAQTFQPDQEGQPTSLTIKVYGFFDRTLFAPTVRAELYEANDPFGATSSNLLATSNILNPRHICEGLCAAATEVEFTFDDAPTLRINSSYLWVITVEGMALGQVGTNQGNFVGGPGWRTPCGFLGWCSFFDFVPPGNTPTGTDLVPLNFYFVLKGRRSSPATPTGLGAIVGNGSIYLRWDTPQQFVDEYQIRIGRVEFDGTFTFLGQQVFTPRTLTFPDGGETQDAAALITSLPGGSPIDNMVTYTFRVTAIKNNQANAPSDPVFARLGFGGSFPMKPQHPILVLHGFGGDGCYPFLRDTGLQQMGSGQCQGDNGSFADTLHFLRKTLSWRYGGQLYHLQNSLETFVDGDGSCDPAVPTSCSVDQSDPNGDFFTASFADNTGGLAQQGDEVNAFVEFLKPIFSDPNRRLSLVAHSNGGLAARDYLTRYTNPESSVSDLVTYGTPHRGADLGLARLGVFLFQGARDAAFECSGVNVIYPDSAFLTASHLRQLPSGAGTRTVSYASIVGHKDLSLLGFTMALFGGHRGLTDDCHSRHWDGLVPVSSADLTQAGGVSGLAIRIFKTNRGHMGQGNDFPTILCALQPNCMQIKVMSPVDVEVTAPDGGQIATNLAAIPGATYMQIEESPGHETATMLIPFPLAGEYVLKAIPKPATSPTDTFTIIVTQNGVETVVAQDMPVQDSPADGFSVRSNTPPVANAGPDQTMECASHMGTPAVLDGTGSFDPDGDPLGYRWSDSTGDLVGSSAQVIVTLPLGTHMFSLTVSDTHGASSSDSVVIIVQDTTPPVLTLTQEKITVVIPTASATGASVDLGGTVSATDLCDSDVTVTHDAPALFPIGATVVTFTAQDDSGNTSQKQLTVHVVYNFGGFLPPINAVGSSVFRSGRTIPVKFQLTAGDGSLITSAAATLHVFKVTDQLMGIVEEVTADAAGASNTDNVFRYDPIGNQYIYNLKTTGYTAGTYILRVSLNDGTTHEVYISVR